MVSQVVVSMCVSMCAIKYVNLCVMSKRVSVKGAHSDIICGNWSYISRTFHCSFSMGKKFNECCRKSFK